MNEKCKYKNVQKSTANCGLLTLLTYFYIHLSDPSRFLCLCACVCTRVSVCDQVHGHQ